MSFRRVTKVQKNVSMADILTFCYIRLFLIAVLRQKLLLQFQSVPYQKKE